MITGKMRTVILVSFLLLTFPTVIYAEDLVPAICKQVLEPQANFDFGLF